MEKCGSYAKGTGRATCTTGGALIVACTWAVRRASVATRFCSTSTRRPMPTPSTATITKSTSHAVLRAVALAAGGATGLVKCPSSVVSVGVEVGAYIAIDLTKNKSRRPPGIGLLSYRSLGSLPPAGKHFTYRSVRFPILKQTQAVVRIRRRHLR